jgi:hypothetical protein
VEVFLLVSQGFIWKGNTELENWDFRKKCHTELHCKLILRIVNQNNNKTAADFWSLFINIADS